MEDQLIGKTLGQYRIVAPIGEGGMGVVYRAQDVRLNREVAIKVLPPELARDHEFVERFEREAHTAASLDHPNIVAIYNIGEQENLHYIAMRLLRGQTLNHLLRQSGALPLPRMLRLLEQVASALDYAHGNGIVHRDIKPANIMVGAEDYVTLMDFGIARALVGSKLTRTGMMIGTPEYMAPEQFTGEPVDIRADVYALSVVLYEMLTGHVPFSGDTPIAVSHGHVYQSPAPPSHFNSQIPPAVEQVVLRGLAKRPDARYASAGALVADLRAALEGRAAATPASQPLALRMSDGREIPLTPGVLRLGRASDNELALQDAQASRYHAEIRSDAQGHALVDLGSANGTYLNGQRIPPHQPQTLQAGMQIFLGTQTTLVVQVGSVASAAGGGKTVAMSGTAAPPLVSPTQPTVKPQPAAQSAKKGPLWIGLVLVVSGVAAVLLLRGSFMLLFNASDPTPRPPTRTVAAPEAAPATATVTTPPSTRTPRPTAEKATAAPKPTEAQSVATPIRTSIQQPPQLVYACGSVGSADICLIDLESERIQTIVTHSADDAEPDSSGDGRLAFQSNRTGNYDIWISDRQGRSLTNLTQTPDQNERMPDWSPDGQLIAYEVGDGSSNSELWVVELDDAQRLPLMLMGRAPVWSPQGDRLAFMYKESDGYWKIHVLDLKNKREIVLPHAREHCRFPGWSPDGGWITYNTYVFSASPKGQTYEVWRTPSDGSGQPERLTASSDNGRPAWSPDGKSIAYNHGEYLYTLSINDGMRTRQLNATLNGWAPEWVYGTTD